MKGRRGGRGRVEGRRGEGRRGEGRRGGGGGVRVDEGRVVEETQGKV